MKRAGHLFEKFVTYENLDLAEQKARKGKGSRHEVRRFLKNRESKLKEIQRRLESGEWRMSKRSWKKIYDPKERWIGVSKYEDLIVQYALLNQLEPVFMRTIISDTYSCIKGRGIHACEKKVMQHFRKDPKGTFYCLQIDISKCYDNINHEILKGTLRRLVKDERILSVVFEIIDSESGIVIGDHIASWLCNIYLSPIDHKAKEVLRLKHYFRYADDIVIFAATKEELWRALEYLERELKAIGLRVKHNVKVIPVDKEGLNFIGYVFRHTHVLIRKRIKKHLWKKVNRMSKSKPPIEQARQELAGHWGWLKHCDSKHLQKSINEKLGYNENLFQRNAA